MDANAGSNVGSMTNKQGCAGEAYRSLSTAERVDSLFSYHAPRPDQIPKYEAIRDAAKYFANILLKNTPPSADQSAAIRLLRESVMTANAAIANDGMGI